MKIMKISTLTLCIVAVLAAALIYLEVSGVELRKDFGEFVVDRLIALTVIAAVVERALEVLIEPWRGPGKDALIAAKNTDQLSGCRNDTRLIGMMAGTAFGLLIAAIGFRLIEPMAIEGSWDTPGILQSVLRTTDVVLIALLIGGGSDALHQLVSVVVDSLKASRAKINATAP